MLQTRAPTLIVLLALILSGPATAQTAPPSAPASVSAPTPQEATQALAILQDDAKRAAMIGVLQTLARAGAQSDSQSVAQSGIQAGNHGAQATATGAPAPTADAASVGAAGGAPHSPTPAAALPKPATPAAPASPAPAKLVIPLAPDSLGAQLLVGVSERLDALSEDVSGTVRTLANFTLLQRWARSVLADPDSRAEVLDAAWKTLVVALVVLASEALLIWLLARPHAGLLRIAPPHDPDDEQEPEAGGQSPIAKAEIVLQRRQRRRRRAVATLRRVPLTVARLLLDLVPVFGVAAAGYGLLSTRLGEPSTTKLVILALLNAYIICRLISISAKAILSPDAIGLRLVRIDDHLAWTALRWMRRLAVVALFGYAATEVALLFGLYRVAHDALLKLVALAVHLMLVVIVLQNRVAVARLIRAAPGQTGVVAAARNRIAAVWHIVVIFYIVALWTVWALNVQGGFQKLVVVFVSTVAISILGRLLVVLLSAWLDHAFLLDTAAAAKTPGLDLAIRRYRPVARTVLEASVALLAIILLLQIWGLDSLSWFGGNALGGRLLAVTLHSVITIAIGLVIWEVSNVMTQNHLARLAREGHPARSARLRTLLPMLRTTLLVTIVLFVSLTILSQIGVNIAPLLAGASVVGLAIGFGSQKLVQDIITGLFLLLENTMQVGDVVTLGGLTGTVENLSVRTIRLRALDGAVHIVPFSAVTTVTNLTRDFAYAMLDVSVGLNEEPDAIIKVVLSVAETMRREPRWAAAITADMEIMGVEAFVDTAWVLRCRVKTLPGQRWAVSRELNRRLKYRFDLDAIESPFTSYRALANAVPTSNAEEAA